MMGVHAQAPQVRGFSLLELLVASAIMAISLGMLYRASGGSARHVGSIEQQQRVLVLAESLLDLRDAVPAQGWNERGESAGMRWSIATTPYATDVTDPRAPRLHEVQVRIDWDGGQGAQTLTFHTLRPERRPVPGGPP